MSSLVVLKHLLSYYLLYLCILFLVPPPPQVEPLRKCPFVCHPSYSFSTNNVKPIADLGSGGGGEH